MPTVTVEVDSSPNAGGILIHAVLECRHRENLKNREAVPTPMMSEMSSCEMKRKSRHCAFRKAEQYSTVDFNAK